jgi:chromatin remodeling complex protein RSC6
MPKTTKRKTKDEKSSGKGVKKNKETVSKKTKLTVETPVEETPVEETPVEETPVEETPVEETPVEETPVEETPVEETNKDQKNPTKESVLEDLDNLVLMIDSEIKNLNDNQVKNNGAKFLRTLKRHVKSLRVKTVRVMNKKHKTTRREGKNVSGFQKPVKISKELAKFASWSEDELHSRVEVTKYICDYIAEHKLQNPSDRRKINPDIKLQKLLNFNPKTSETPLCYYNIQTHLKKQNHFPKD